MILAVVGLAMQPVLTPAAVSDSFLAICRDELSRPAALREAIRRSPLGFTRAADRGAFEVYRAGETEILFRAGEGCGFEAAVADEGEGVAVIDRVAAAMAVGAGSAGVNRNASATHYRWPRPARAGATGLSAVLHHPGRLGGRGGDVRVSLWAYLASGR